MRLSSFLPVAIALTIAAVLAVGVAALAANKIERLSQQQVARILQSDGQAWAHVDVNGLQVRLTGTAPDEATRFRALTLAGQVVDATRVIDAMQVTPGKPVAAPRFSIEILRNDTGISLIGLVPRGMDRTAVVAAIAALANGADVTDLLDVANYPIPDGWAEALKFAISALSVLPRSKISVSADHVAITAIAGSPVERRRLETDLARQAPDSLDLALHISSPRPVIAPFTLRFVIDASGGRFDACSADTENGRARILAAAAEAGLQGRTECPLGLGVPSPSWPDAVTAAIGALAELGQGSVTFSDADVSLVADAGTDQAVFDRVTGELEAALPDVFSLKAILPRPVQIDGTGSTDAAGPPEFVATLSPEGLLQLRGRIGTDRLRKAVEGFARARFGSAEVQGAMRLDPALPARWPIRVLTAVDALSLLNNGAAVVQPRFIDIRGDTGSPDARAEISRILSAQLGPGEDFAIDVSYHETLDPVAALPTPQECVAAINAILSARQVTFQPGSPEIDTAALPVIDRIAEVMADCSDVKMEIGGHTDSQGRESMNRNLSQLRAQAVLQALLARRVLTSNLTAKGYGESKPIADNGTEEGRKENRRIEFTLIGEAAPTDGSATDTAETETGPTDVAPAGDQPRAPARPEIATDAAADAPPPDPQTGTVNE